MKLDHETQSSYTVVLTATDPSGASDTTNVNITVTDENDPAVIVGDKEIDYAENGDGAVATYTATDQDGTDIVWEDLAGVDASLFEIEDGVLTFKDSPNYESAKDVDENTGRSRRPGARATIKYQVTVKASGGEHKVTVTVTNVDEAGSVSFTQVQPQATVELMASFADQDGKKGPDVAVVSRRERGRPVHGRFGARLRPPARRPRTTSETTCVPPSPTPTPTARRP